MQCNINFLGVIISLTEKTILDLIKDNSWLRYFLQSKNYLMEVTKNQVRFFVFISSSKIKYNL